MTEPPVQALAQHLTAQEITHLDRALAKDALNLPVLPDVAAKILSEDFSVDADVQALSRLIHRDQTLAGHVLRVANSAAYFSGTQIVSLQQAVVRLGMMVLREIITGVVVRGSIFDARTFGDRMRGLWAHSAASGAFAKEIARLRRLNVEGAFLCGLLHDVGKPLVLQALAEMTKKAKAEGKALEWSDPAVNEALVRYHTAVGRSLAETWQLPAPVVEAIAFHHDWKSAPTQADSAQVASYASYLAHVTLEPDDFSEESARTHSILVELNLYPDEVDGLLAKRDSVRTFVEALA